MEKEDWVKKLRKSNNECHSKRTSTSNRSSACVASCETWEIEKRSHAISTLTSFICAIEKSTLPRCLTYGIDIEAICRFPCFRNFLEIVLHILSLIVRVSFLLLNCSQMKRRNTRKLKIASVYVRPGTDSHFTL